MHQPSSSNTIETVVKLFGNPNDNINTILSTLKLPETHQANVLRVLTILYGKIEKLRSERNIFRDRCAQKQKQVSLMRGEKDRLDSELGEIRRELENMTAKPSSFEAIDYSFDQTPPMKQVYMSMQFGQDKQNKPLGLDQIKVSSFQSEQHDLGGQIESLMKKYNLSVGQFKRVLLMYAQEQRKALEELETDSQRELYLQSKKTGNYEEWLKRMSKQMAKGKSTSNLTSVCSNYR